MSRDELERWEEFRLNASEMLLDTVYLALATGCIAGLHFEVHYLLPPAFEIVPGMLSLEDVFIIGHAIPIGRWVILTGVRAACT